MAESVLILTEDEELLDDLLRLCAAAGAQTEVLHGTPVDSEQWQRAPLVLAGDDWAARQQTGRPPDRRAGVLLVGRDPDDHSIWARGVALGAEQVLQLPGDEAWLADRIADSAEDGGGPALTLGVLGGRGGAGASTLACALAVTAARDGQRTMLIDSDPLGGGLDVLLGAERTPGLRWPAFASSRGRLPAAALEESLPRLRRLSLLSWDRGDAAGAVPLPRDAMRSVLAAARRRGGAVVLDLPRTLGEASAEALAHVDLGLLVVPAELRAVAAARRVVESSGALLRDLRVVARGPGSGALDGEAIGRLLGLPLAGELPDEPGLPAAADTGEPPGADPSGPLAEFCSALLHRALPGRGVAA
ncbi:septum formation initiator [Streptomyces sp. ACA25]|uniref:septum site-determining protein Ssd n=1 Tax=Streptomyces sp. ACA25 TaxID=3022596 RepID=UPI00230764BF|nr:septum site-determining protein Ssd [Streptomyces sp. ACA25]MDB1086521.1 septum formation initiator [Streptomyces sp. ACA25]